MNCIYYESKFRIKKYFLLGVGDLGVGEGGGGTRVSELFLQRI